MNKITIVGNITKDAEGVTLSNGTLMAKFSIAENYTQNGENCVNYFDCAVFGRLAESIGKYLNKGQKIAVCGSVKIKVADDGKRYINVLCDNVEFCGGKRHEEESDAEKNEAVFKKLEAKKTPLK